MKINDPACRCHMLHLAALRTPAVIRHCARCGSTRRFASSDRFRINANQRRLDVWLIYRCCTCQSTWNSSIYERYPVDRLPANERDAFFSNDRSLAWRYAFDTSALRRRGLKVDDNTEFAITGTLPAPAYGVPLVVELRLVHPVKIRFDRALARMLGITRSTLQRAIRNGNLHITCDSDSPRRALRQPVADGLRFALRARASAVETGMPAWQRR